MCSIQLKEDLERWYERPDPWSYECNAFDHNRKDRILKALEEHAPFDRALDVGCGEGFITRDLPAKKLYGYEISDKAAERWPENIKRVFFRNNDDRSYDLVVATGVLYKQYDHDEMRNFILDHANGIILTSHIKSWEIPLEGIEQIYHEEFQYRDYIQVLRVFDVSGRSDYGEM